MSRRQLPSKLDIFLLITGEHVTCAQLVRLATAQLAKIRSSAKSEFLQCQSRAPLVFFVSLRNLLAAKIS